MVESETRKGSGTLPRRSYPLLALPRPAQLCRAVCGAVVRGTAPLKNSSGPDECPAKTPVATGPVPFRARVRCQSLPFFVNVSPACRGTPICHMLIKRYPSRSRSLPAATTVMPSCRPLSGSRVDHLGLPCHPECLIPSPFGIAAFRRLSDGLHSVAVVKPICVSAGVLVAPAIGRVWVLEK